MVNRELAKRVRTVSGAAVLKGWVENDITMAMKLILRLDEKFEVWKQQEKFEAETKKVEAVKQDETAEEGSSEGQKTEGQKTEEVSASLMASWSAIMLKPRSHRAGFVEL